MHSLTEKTEPFQATKIIKTEKIKPVQGDKISKSEKIESSPEDKISKNFFFKTEKMEQSEAAKISKTHWSQGLYASMNDKDLVVYKDDMICIVKDKYPKAIKHFLVMPIEKLQTLNDLSR